MNPPRTTLAIIQANSFCNIDCSYCYLPSRTDNKRISESTLRLIFRRLLNSSLVHGELEILWHAGEPLVVGPEFYKKAIRTAEEENIKDVRLRHVIQTNGTLLNQEWCDLIKKFGIGIGVSLDGPKEIHDHRRKDRRGNGTFERTMAGVRLLQKNRIPFSIIAVLTERALDNPESIWNFFVQEGIQKLAFNIEEIEGANKRSSLNQDGIDQKYTRFFFKLIELWERDGRRFDMSVREIDFLMNALRYGREPVRATQNTAFDMLSFDVNGNVSTFSPELLTQGADFHFGNIHTNRLEDMSRSASFIQIKDAILSGKRRCENECPYFVVCGGGSPINKLCENGTFDSTETLYCRLRVKAATEAVLGFLEEKHGIAQTTK